MKNEYYEFESLKDKALRSDSFDDKKELLSWFENFGSDCWNGEYYQVDESNRLFPIYQEVSEDIFELVDIEIR